MTKEFQIRRAESDDDWDFFFNLSLSTMKTMRQFALDELLQNNPGVDVDDDARLLELHRKEVNDFFDFSDSKARVFIAERNDGVLCGYLWMGSRNSRDAWDAEIQQWIYDIVVDPRFYGNRIGRLLLEKAEEFSAKLNLNLGLFVHADNLPALALYEKSEYVVKQVPVSRVFPYESQDIHPGDGFIVREMKDDEYDTIVQVEFDQFKKKVEFSVDVDIDVVKKLHQEHLGNYFNDDEDHQRFIALTEDDEVIGTIWVGSSGFNKLIAKMHEITIDSPNPGDKIADVMISTAEKWARGKKFSSIYILLHSTDSLEVDFFRERGYKVPGFFMEKHLK